MGVVASKDASVQHDLTEDTQKIQIEEWTISDPGDAENLEQTLAQLTLTGYVFSHRTTRYTPDSIFLTKNSQYKFKVLSKECLRGLRLITTAHVSEELHAGSVVGAQIPREILNLNKGVKTLIIGDREPSDTSYIFDAKIYVPKALKLRQQYFYLIDADEILLAKARTFIAVNSDFDDVPDLEPALKERANRVKSMIAHIQEGTLLGAYKKGDLTNAINEFKNIVKCPVQYILAADNVPLAYRYYETTITGQQCASIVFASYDSLLLDNFAVRLTELYPISVYIYELRGSGYSGGERGMAKSVEELWHDTSIFVETVQKNTNLPVYLMGNFLTGALVLNYATWKDRVEADGYIFVSPRLGKRNEGAWRKSVLESFKTNRAVKDGGVTLAKLTHGRFGGKETAMTMEVNDDVCSLNPTVISNVSANALLAMTPENPRKQFKEIKTPFSFFVGSLDEFFKVDQLAKIPNSNSGESNLIKILEGATHLSTITSAAPEIGAWIKNMSRSIIIAEQQHIGVSKARSYSVASLDSTEHNSCDPLMREMVQSSLKSAEKRAIDALASYLRMEDGEFLAYQRFDPFNGITPVAIFILFCRPEYSHFVPQLASDFCITCYRVDVRGFGLSSGKRGNVKSKKTLWNDVRRFVKFVRANHSSSPIFLGGFSADASLIINYASWKHREDPHGYILISPLPHPGESQNRKYIKPQLHDFTTISAGKGLFSKESDPVAALRESKFQSDLLIISPAMTTVYGVKYAKSLFPENIVAQIKAIDLPFILIFGKNDQLIHTQDIYDAILKQTEMSEFQKIHIESHESHISVLDKTETIIGGWISSVASIVSPKTRIVVENPKLSDFEPIEQIGKGSFGQVWLVKHKESGNYMALKRISKRKVIETKQIRAVFNEKTILRELSNGPFIVPFINSFKDRDYLYILMEFIVGGELYTRISAAKKFSVEVAKFYAAELLLGIKYIHERGIVYRDLKSENLLIDSLGHLRVGDFGFARHADGPCKTFCGSPYYIAPEILLQSPYHKSVDMWSFGVLLFEMLTGTPPFTGHNANEIYNRILFSTVEFPAHFPQEARDLINKLLHPSPDYRIGCGSHGIEEVMKHRFFRGIDWRKLEMKQVVTPFQPKVSFDGDTVHFVKGDKAGINRLIPAEEEGDGAGGNAIDGVDGKEPVDPLFEGF